MSRYAIEGMENLQRIFKEFPEKGYRKPIIASFRKAAEPVKKGMIASLPQNLRALKKAIKIKPGKGRSMTLSVGAFGNEGSVFRNSRGIDWDPFMILYWHNYGTLDWRTSLARLHVFKYPRRTKTANWSGGIRPGFFIEKGWEMSKRQAQSVFEKSVDEEITKFLEKNAVN